MFGLGPEWIWLAPYFMAAATIFGLGSLGCFAWPLRQATNRDRLLEVCRHPLTWLPLLLNPKRMIFAGLAIIVAGIAVLGIGLLRQPSLQSNAMVWTTNPPPPFQGAPIAWKMEPGLEWSKQGPQFVARTLSFEGQNAGPQEIQLEDVYLLSGVTGARINMKIEAADGRTAIMVPAKDTNPVPPKAFFRARTDQFNGTAGVPEEDFLREWGTIYLVAEYGGKQHRIPFDRSSVASLFEKLHDPPVPPHVTLRKAQ